ncbi:MAG: hypothetical protein LBU24_05125 [Methanocalculaceae archaeon]|jgi:proteasome assembly chaperone (PAC2) family protein|nr:hypothetical protein [Methanocalculaceae archaeon]
MESVRVRWYVGDVSAHATAVAVAGLPGVGPVGKQVVEYPRVFSAQSSPPLKKDAFAVGAVISPVVPLGGIARTAGLLITRGRLYSMEGVAPLDETSGCLVDPVSPTAVLDVLERLTPIHADRTELTELAEWMIIEAEAIGLAAMPKPPDDLSCIR